MDQLDDLGIAYEYVPGVSSFCAAAAALNAEYTLPDVSQTVIITRMAGRTPVPEKEEIAKLAAHQATMVIFLSTGLLEGLQERLMAGGYSADTPAAIVYKASWPDQKVFRCTVSTLAQTAKEKQHHQDCADSGRKLSGRQLFPLQALRPELHHRVPPGKAAGDKMKTTLSLICFTQNGAAAAARLLNALGKDFAAAGFVRSRFAGDWDTKSLTVGKARCTIGRHSNFQSPTALFL